LDGTAIELVDAIPRGHKFALRSVSADEPVRKYGQVIGRATARIARGAHVHTHNLKRCSLVWMSIDSHREPTVRTRSRMISCD